MFSETPRPSLEPTQPRIQWVQGAPPWDEAARL